MSAKKILFIFSINLIAIFLICISMHFYIFYKDTTLGSDSKPEISYVFQQYISFLVRDISEKDTYHNLIHSEEFRAVENKDSKKKPILIFGCSFAWGSDLEENQTISYKLGQATKRPIYNRARMGWSVQHMLYQLQQDEFYKIVPKPEYIIYICIGGHEIRLNTPVSPTFPNCYYIFYKMKNDKLIQKKRTFYSDKFLFQHFINNKYPKSNITDMLPYFKEAKNIVEKKWGKDVKFVILFYERMENEKLLSELKKLGFIMINEDEMPIKADNVKYHLSETDNHPNEKAWDEIVPFLVKRLKLND